VVLKMGIDVERLHRYGGSIKATKFFEEVITFGSVDVDQEIIIFLSEQSGIKAVVFYGSKFFDVDFSKLNGSGVEVVSVINTNFDRNNLWQMKDVDSLKTLSVFDSLVCDKDAKEFLNVRPDVDLRS